MNYELNEKDLNKTKEIIKKIDTYYSSKIVGQSNLKEALMISMMTNGHLLLESVPGLAKTTSAKVMMETVNGKFSRIQCTPDLLPSDIIGTQIFNYKTNEFENKLGPVFANFVLLDEINRSSAKSQSAMLEAMQERKVTIGGKTYSLPDVFIVMATQNPIEQEGTYLLAEAQTDRFYLKEKITYPTEEEELEIINRIEKSVFDDVEIVSSLNEIKYLQTQTKKVYMDESIKKYILNIINIARYPKQYMDSKYSEYIENGPSTRCAIAFLECSKAYALLNGRAYVIPEDIKALRYMILRHRISLNFSAEVDGITTENIIDEIIRLVPVP